MDNLSIITTHFYDFSWIKVWVKRLQKNTDCSKIKEIFIINQDRTVKSLQLLKKIAPNATILEFPRNEEQFVKMGHDHAAVLNLAIKKATGDYICIFDSDCHPFSTDWLPVCETLLRQFDAIVAQDMYLSSKKCELLSHPCFMIVNKKHLTIPLLFDEGFPAKGYDTGRLIGRQLERTGNKVFYAEPKTAFNGMHGQIFLNAVYHHKKGSFLGGDQRLKRQVDFRDSFFRKVIVKHNRYQLSRFDELRYNIIKYGLCKYLMKILKK